jgi:hypothetical protein
VSLRHRLATFAVAAALIAATFLCLFQSRLYGDYAGLSATGVDWSEQRHWLYFALHELLHACSVAPEFALRLLSSVPMAVGLFVCVASSRVESGRVASRRVERAAASGAAAMRVDAGALVLLLLAPPVCVFFGTTIELHGLHLLGAALAFACASRAARAVGVVRFAWLAPALAAPLVFHPLLLLQAPALIALAWRREPRLRRHLTLLAAAAVLALPLLSFVLPAESGAGLPARAADLLQALKFAFRATAAGLLPGPSDFALHAWRELALPLGVLGIAFVIELALRIRERSEWLVPAAALGVHAAILPLLGVREYGAYGLGLVPFAFELTDSLLARVRERGRYRHAALVALLVLAQTFASARRIASYAAIGDDRVWIEQCVQTIAAVGTPHDRAYVLTQCSPRWELLLRDHGILGCDLRFAADEVPIRHRVEVARRTAETARLQVAHGFTLYVDRAVLGAYPGNEALPEFVAALRARAEFLPVGGENGPLLRLAFRDAPEAR